MKRKFLIILITILTLSCYSQISYEKGYYIDNNNQKINCLIKNIDWRNSPTQFEYKISENSEPQIATFKTAKEFGVYNISKYIKSVVNIDRSHDNINNLTTDKNPVFNKETLFLKVLVEGKSNLYQYIDGKLNRYFYGNDVSNIKQLVFKVYKIENNDIRKNNRFRQQLWNDLKCPNFKMNRVEKLNYRKKDLVAFFTDYSKCHNKEIVSLEPKQKRDLFNLTIRPRFYSSTLSIKSTNPDFSTINFDMESGIRFGLEAEFILPFNKNKWALAAEPTYQKFKAEQSADARNINGGKIIANLDYTSIEVPVSIRHYIFLNEKSKIFVDASLVFDFSSNSTIDIKRNDGSSLYDLDIKTSSNLALAVGYKLNETYSLSLRYQTKRDLLATYTGWVADYNTVSMIFGYSLF
ncbi:tRNA modification GTPase [Algibacter sp. AS12]|uniref:tRNA modification GTPase n=1 Tax=Algibacter sp. AS12 TaxID=3135773 RepID=UPI00398ADE67